MRSEQEMYELILKIAQEDERVLAVYMNGSRTNPNVPKDIFQDYDVVYVVEETGSFIADKNWIRKFGEILYMQYPDEWPDNKSDKQNCYGWLVQFSDGNRIDLHVQTVRFMEKAIFEDKLCRILLDKKGILPPVPEATDEDFRVGRPTGEWYYATCNEFWWCTNNIAKGLWREEFPYVQDMTNGIVRPQLQKMLSWKIGFLTEFKVSVGKSAKYMYRWLEKEEWDTYLSTWFSCETEEAWDAVLRMCTLFEKTARYVGEQIGCPYHAEEGKNARAYLEHVRTLPKDAQEVYRECDLL